MELTIDQALACAVVCKKDGKLGQAGRLYGAIKGLEPSHRDANHNLGVLALSLDKGDDALPLLENEVKSDQSATQHWLSYI